MCVKTFYVCNIRDYTGGDPYTYRLLTVWERLPRTRFSGGLAAWMHPTRNRRRIDAKALFALVYL